MEIADLFVTSLSTCPNNEESVIRKIGEEKKISNKQVLKDIIYYMGTQKSFKYYMDRHDIRESCIEIQQSLQNLFLISIQYGGEYRIYINNLPGWDELLKYQRMLWFYTNQRNQGN